MEIFHLLSLILILGGVKVENISKTIKLFVLLINTKDSRYSPSLTNHQ